MPSQRELAGTRAVLEQGISSGLHLGGQLYASLRSSSSQKSEPLIDWAFGEARPGEPMTPRHLMLWLSSSKPVTAVLVGRLWEQGRLHLDDPVSLHFPEFGAQGKAAITLRHLLTHTGGIRMLNLGWPQTSWEEILKKICARKPEPNWVPGAKAGYHLSSSWFVLGEIIQRLTGETFSGCVRRQIFEPLGMPDCWIGMPANVFTDIQDRLAPMYDTSEFSKESAIPMDWHSAPFVTHPSPGGNGYGPMNQLGRFYEMLLGGGAISDQYDQHVLSEQTVEALTARHRVGLHDHTFKHQMDWSLGFIPNSRHYDIETTPYGYGNYASTRTFGHSGNRSSTGFADPEHGLVVTLAVNGLCERETHRQRFTEILDQLYQDLGLPLSPRKGRPSR